MLKRLTRWSVSLVVAVCMLVSGLLLVTNNPTKAMADPEPNYPLQVVTTWDPSGDDFDAVRNSIVGVSTTYGTLAADYDVSWGANWMAACWKCLRDKTRTRTWKRTRPLSPDPSGIRF